MSNSDSIQLRERKLYVPDTSAILTGKIDLLSLECIIPPRVIAEIKKGKEGRILDSSQEVLKIMEPSEFSRKIVRERSENSGDLPFLSLTDVDVIALALERKGIILTDDYSLQNVATGLGIEVVAVGLPKIRNEKIWGYRCKSCGKTFGTMITVCNVCGGRIGRYPLTEK